MIGEGPETGEGSPRPHIRKGEWQEGSEKGLVVPKSLKDARKGGVIGARKNLFEGGGERA